MKYSLKLRVIIFLLVAGVLVSCTSTPVKPVPTFRLQSREYLYEKKTWSFSGRIALTNEKESLSLSINWKHRNKQDSIELSGPFGQGRTILKLSEEELIIDDGEKPLKFVGNVDDQIARYVGLNIPISALKYWVLGLVKPKARFVAEKDGFSQFEWRIKYQQMQFFDGDELPKKIKVERFKQGNEKLKLIIDYWGL